MKLLRSPVLGHATSHDKLDTIGKVLDEARAKIEKAHQALEAAPQEAFEIRQAVARLERMEKELARIEGSIVVREGLA